MKSPVILSAAKNLAIIKAIWRFTIPIVFRNRSDGKNMNSGLSRPNSTQLKFPIPLEI